MPLLARAFGYLCIAITAEILFTGVKSLVLRKDRTMQAHTTLWMFPVYFFGLPFGFEPVHRLVASWPWPARGALYAALILAAEYLLATVYKAIIGKNPWEYVLGWHVHGKIRLDYFPFWMLFGLLLERVQAFLVRPPLL